MRYRNIIFFVHYFTLVRGKSAMKTKELFLNKDSVFGGILMNPVVISAYYIADERKKLLKEMFLILDFR